VAFVSACRACFETAGEKFKREREVDGSVRRSHGEDEAQRILNVGLRTFEIAIDDLVRLPKGDQRKLILAALIRQRKSVPNAWIAQRLNLGHVSRVNRCRIDAPTRIALATLVTQNLDSCAQFTDPTFETLRSPSPPMAVVD
jgi:hypothetical protein